MNITKIKGIKIKKFLSASFSNLHYFVHSFEKKVLIEIQNKAERIYTPLRVPLNIEHERKGSKKEIEFQ